MELVLQKFRKLLGFFSVVRNKHTRILLLINAGEMVEGILRINPKNYEDGYICAADNGQDILIQVGLYEVFKVSSSCTSGQQYFL